MTSRHRVIVFAAALLAVLAPERPAWAGQPTEQLRHQIDRVLIVLGDPELRKEPRALDRRAAVRKIANDIFDFPETAQRSLARHWAPRTPAERAEVVQPFASLLERSYISKIEVYGGEKIQFIGESIDGDRATVRTRITTREGSDIPIDYRMLPRGSRRLPYRG